MSVYQANIVNTLLLFIDNVHRNNVTSVQLTVG